MSDVQPRLTRADLPEEFTTETIRQLPMSTLRRLARPGNGILSPAEQLRFDAVLHEVMRETASRVSRQARPDLARALREANGRGGRRGRSTRPTRAEEQLARLAQRIDQQVGAAEALAPGVDWSFAQAGGSPPAPPTATTPTPPTAPTSETTQTAEPTDTSDTSDTDAGDTGTVSDLEQRLTDQVELVEVMSEIADMSKRTYALEQQRDLQNTRGVFFGFVVSLAVLVAGWAPLVAAKDWDERIWIVGLTLGTCVVAGLVYGLIRRWQNSHQTIADEQQSTSAE